MVPVSEIVFMITLFNWKQPTASKENIGINQWNCHAVIVPHYQITGHVHQILTSIGISIKKIRRSYGSLIFIMELSYLERWSLYWIRTQLMIGQSWFRKWLAARRNQDISSVNVDPDLSRHMASVAHSKLKSLKLFVWYVNPVRFNHDIHRHIFLPNLVYNVAIKWSSKPPWNDDTHCRDAHSYICMLINFQ